MNKKCKELLRKNNEREKEILKNNNEIYTDMIVYLRGSDMTMYNQELVREDLIQMILDGQDRGEDIKKVLGGNYKEVCDEIIESMPKRTKVQKAGGILESSLLNICVLGIITIANFVISALVSGEETIVISLSIGAIINMVIIILAANLIAKYFFKNSFKNSKKNKMLFFIKIWFLCTLLSGVMVMSAYFLDTIVLTISLITAIITVGIVFVIYRLLSLYIL